MDTATTTYNLKYLGSPGISDADFELSPSDDGESVGSKRDDVCGSSKCAEGLALQGKTRAQLLANWMMQNGIVDKLSHVFSSHKRRTALTVEPTATKAGLTIEQFPTDGEELNPEGVGASVCPTVEAIKALPLGSTGLVAVHTSSIYQIMSEGRTDKCNGLGLDISNDTIYPKDENGKLPRPDYSFVWQLSIDEDGNATLAKRYTLDLAFTESVQECEWGGSLAKVKSKRR